MIVRRNRDRISLLWTLTFDYLSTLLREARVPSSVTERATVGLLRLCTRLLHKDEVAITLQGALDTISEMHPAVFEGVCEAVAFGVRELIKTNAHLISSPAAWWGLGFRVQRDQSLWFWSWIDQG